MATQRERNDAKRDRKLREIDDAVEQGRLVVRRMTPAERKRFPPRERPPQRQRSTRR
jgi:hypothetical protein